MRILGIIFILTAGTFYLSAQNTLFTLEDASRTGITFSNNVHDKVERNILIYDNFYQGAGVGIGDFNNDGLQDIYFAGNLVGDQLYLNKGGLHFDEITQNSGIIDDGSWSSGVTIADVNGDGWLDIYVSKELYDDRPELWKNKLYINNGDLTFTESADAYGLGHEVRSRHATFFDYDKDGDLDVFVLNQPPNPGKYSDYLPMSDNGQLLSEEFAPRLYKNENNKFVDVSEASGVLHPGFCNAVTAADINGDGWQDLYVANDFEAPDFLYINNRDGTFTNKANTSLKHIPFFSMGVDITDINNDAMPDILVVDMSAEDNYRSKVNMSGMNPEKFWGVVNKGWHYQYMYNALQINVGNGYFSDVAQMTGVSSTDWSWSPLMADLDNDGYKDVFVTNGLYRDIRNNDADKAIKKHINSKIMGHYQKTGSLDDVVIWDLIDLDKVLSIYPSQKLMNYAYKNLGGFNFEKSMKIWGLEELTFSSGSAYADLDNDGDLDLVVSNLNDRAYVYRNNTNQQSENSFIRIKLNGAGGTLSPFGAKARVVIGDNVQTHELSNTRGMFSTSEAVFHFGLGKTESIDSVEVTWPDGSVSRMTNIEPNQSIVLEYDNSTRVLEKIKSYKEIAHSDKNFNHRHQENDFDDFKREPLLPHKMSNLGPAVACADVNGDGLEDVFVGGAVGFSGTLYTQAVEKGFVRSETSPWEKDAMCEDVSATFLDIDNDGDLDLYVVSGGNEHELYSSYYKDRLYLNDGQGNFEKDDQLPEVKDSGGVVLPADFDADGDVDVFVAGRQVPGRYPQAASSRLLRNENGKLTDVTSELSPGFVQLGMVTSAVWTDFNLDGQLDIILVGEWMPIMFFEQKNGFFVNVTERYGKPSELGWYYSIVATDMDADGDDDYIVGNLGLNYKYKASEKEPFHIYYNDFDKNGNGDIVLGYNQSGKVFPVRGRECSSQQIPSIKDKFENYEKFAIADVFQVYGKSNLQSSLHYQATTFESVYLKNIEGRAFESADLPIEAQFSSVNSILINDFNKDGYADALLAGNMYGSEVETPRNDAGYGLILLGNGVGEFNVLKPSQTGLYLNGDIKTIKLVEAGGEPHLLVGKNNDFIEIIPISKIRTGKQPQ